jgi:hypothetical protein
MDKSKRLKWVPASAVLAGLAGKAQSCLEKNNDDNK